MKKYIHKTQYGFRKAHSTTDAIYIARRIQDFAEEGQDNVLMTLLDWEKAFDKVDQLKLIEAFKKIKYSR